MFKTHLRISLVTLFAFSVLTGVVYPLLITGIAQAVFPGKANGSLVMKGEKVVGSDLIGQPFSGPEYFWGRLSATSPFPYNAGASSGSNYGPLNPAFLDMVTQRVHALRAADTLNTKPIPVDLVTSSGSGLDPHITVGAALFQAERVARLRNMTVTQVRSLIDRCTEGRQLGILGEPRVNVLQLNLALNETSKPSEGK